jgi:phosphoglycolate phosphatase-like HAD superfamily hydrolase
LPTLIDAVRNAIGVSRRVIFDFDGTLADTNEIKTRAFDLVFKDYPEHMEEIQAYCHSFNHTIRGEKFKYVAEKILGLQYTPERDRQFHEAYARFTTDVVVAAPEIPGATSFLRRIRSSEPALVSSTPHDILLEILERRGWRSMFGEIRGAPVNKRDWLNSLQKSLGCRAEALLFFGDTDEDETSARESGCTFVRVGSDARHGELAIQDFTCL